MNDKDKNTEIPEINFECQSHTCERLKCKLNFKSDTPKENIFLPDSCIFSWNAHKPNWVMTGGKDK